MKNKSIQHWVTIAICCGLTAVSVGICSNTLGVFFPSVSTDLGVGRGTFAFHATLSSLLTGLFSPIAMQLLKKYNFRSMISLGILMAGGSTLLMAVGTTVWDFYILGAIRGIGCGFFSLVTITYIIGNWFEEGHGFAVGLTLSFSGLSGALFSPLFGYLITLFGWRFTYGVMGFFILALALPGTLFLLESHPEKKNLLPFGWKTGDKVVLPYYPAATGKAEFLSLPFIALAVFSILIASITAIAQHFPGYADSFGSSVTLGAAMVSAAMLGNIVFKLLIGILSDKIGAISACTIMVSSNMLALILLSLINPAEQYPVTIAFAFIFGAIYAVGAVGISLVTRYVFGVERYAAVYPYISLFLSIGAAISLTLIGSLYDFFGSYRISIIIGAVFGGVSLLLLQVLRARKPAAALSA